MKGVIFMGIIKKRLADNKNKQLKRELSETRIKALKNAGYSNEEISRVSGLPESTIRVILKSQEKESK